MLECVSLGLAQSRGMNGVSLLAEVPVATALAATARALLDGPALDGRPDATPLRALNGRPAVVAG
jgi:hypothetical protein